MCGGKKLRTRGGDRGARALGWSQVSVCTAVLSVCPYARRCRDTDVGAQAAQLLIQSPEDTQVLSPSKEEGILQEDATGPPRGTGKSSERTGPRGRGEGQSWWL